MAEDYEKYEGHYECPSCELSVVRRHDLIMGMKKPPSALR